jgi:AcrR family transcriptional regulator
VAPVTTPVRRGRRPGESHTREAVLEAARARFAADGYAGTTVRAIAADAGVDPALVVRLHGSKGALFAAVMSIPQPVLDRVAAALTGPPATIGERVARTFLATWEEDPAIAEPLMAMFRSAVAHEQAATQLREFIEDRVVEHVGAHLEGPDAPLRWATAATMLIGLVVGRRVVQVDVLASLEREALVQRVAPAIQAVLLPAS